MTMFMVATTQICAQLEYTLKMNSKFYKTKQTNIKINAHNKTNRTHKKNTKVYIHVRHNCMHNVYVVTMT